MGESWKSGGCHCRKVRFDVLYAEPAALSDCNCSMCTRSGYLHLIVPKSQFRILQGENQLTDYRFNTGAAHHLFCRTCGIKSFYIPRSHPDGYSVNYRCLDEPDLAHASIRPFDGQNWEANSAQLTRLQA